MKIRINPDKCIACTTCVVNCPVSQATSKYLGPRMIGPAYERFRLLALPEEESLTYCSNCKNCDITCPQGVPVASINMVARAEHVAKTGISLRDWVLAHGELQAKLLQLIPAGLKNFGMLNPLTRAVLDAFGIDKRAPLPKFAKKTFRQMLKKAQQPELPRKVVFYPGCFVDVYDPQTGLDMVWAFNRAGYQVISPDNFECCGLPMIANGFWEDGRKRASINLAELAKWRKQGIEAVTGCPSCALTFRHDYPDYYPDMTEEYGMGLLLDAQDFLLRCVEQGELKIDDGPDLPDLKVIYHSACHLRAQGNGLPGLKLMQALKGVTATDAHAGCCGISGSYGFKKEKYDIAQAIGSELFEKVRKSGAKLAASECGTCRVQIEHGSGKKALHPVTILRLRLDPERAAQAEEELRLAGD
ncbi:MAG: anaerobic glycerol-3-phosphate dehydrogenase subunit C [Desulfovibrio sp.]|nr:anaerobic glycerol-3-phosphate dehydrogenase subunit C [Desulfovibrio sp.]